MEGEFATALNNSDPNELESIDINLSNAIDLYARKSQVEELFKSYLHSFNNNDQDVLWMPKTLKSFHICCEGLHFETILRVWQLLAEELKKLTADNISNSDLKNLSPLLRLFTEFINSISLSQVPDKALIQVASSLVDTQKNIVNLIRSCLELKDALLMSKLIHSLTITCELVFKFPTLRQHFIIHAEPHGEGNQLFSVSSICFGFSDKMAAKVHKFMNSQHDKIAFLSWLNLLFFKIKCSSLNLWSKEALISLCDFIILELLESINFVNVDKCTPLLWSRMCRCYHLIFETCSRLKIDNIGSYNKVFSKHLVHSMCEVGECKDITVLFLKTLPNGNVTLDLLNELCSDILEKMCTCFTSKQKKSKKIKSDQDNNSKTVAVLECLNQPLSEFMEILTQENISSKFISLIEDARTRDFTKEISLDNQLKDLLSIILNYLLPFMNRLQKMKCTLAAVVILCQKVLDLDTMMQCLLVIKDSFYHVKCVHLTMKYLPPNAFYDWIVDLYNYLSSVNNEESSVHRTACLQFCKEIHASLISATLKNVVELKRMESTFKTICKGFRSSGSALNEFEIILTNNNLICKALSQQSVDVECLPALKKITKRFLAKTDACLEIFSEMNSIDGSNSVDYKKYLPLVTETMVQIIKLLKNTNAMKSLKDEENEISDQINNIQRHLPFLQNYMLTIIKSNEDIDTFVDCMAFTREMCVLKSDSDENEFIDAVWDSTFEKLLHYEPSNKNEAVYEHLSNLACLLLLSMEKEKLSTAIQQMFSVLDSNSIDWSTVVCQMKVWHSLLGQEIGEKVEEMMIYSCQRLIVSIQRLLFKEPPVSAIDSMLNILSTIVQNKPNFLLLQDLSIILHFTQSVNLELFPNKTTTSSNYKQQLSNFVTVFHGYHRVLDSILNYHSENIQFLVPTLTAAIKKLLQASMWGGQQLTGLTISQEDLQSLESCARCVERLGSSVLEFKPDFGKVAHLLVAEFADCSQKVTLYPIIKMPLLQAVYKWLDMCNEHTTAQLQITLSMGAKEIFRVIYSEFQKYHKYRG